MQQGGPNRMVKIRSLCERAQAAADHEMAKMRWGRRLKQLDEIQNWPPRDVAAYRIALWKLVAEWQREAESMGVQFDD